MDLPQWDGPTSVFDTRRLMNLVTSIPGMGP